MRKVFATVAVIGMSFGIASGAMANPFKKMLNKPVPVKTVADGVQMRSGADDSSEVLATLPKGENLTATSRKGAYWKVKTSAGVEGYVPVTSVQTKAGTNAVKGAAGDAATQVKDAAAGVSGAASDKAAEAKSQSKSSEAKAPEVKADNLEKAANKLFNKKK